MDDVERIAAGLTKAQRWFVSALSASWTPPGDIGANPNHGANRDPRLIEASHHGQGKEYRLTPMGVRVSKILKSQECQA